MVKEYKSNLIRKAFEEFANAHIGQELTTRQINDEVSDMVDDGLGGWCASDFALPETQRKTSNHNKQLFKRIKRGKYVVLGTDKKE